MIRALAASDAELCDAIITALPEWFGVEAGIEDCAAAVRSQDGLVSLAGDDVAGFITWEDRFEETTEITWAAVHPEHHRQGHGRALVAEMLRIAGARGIRLAVVHTLSSTAPTPTTSTRGRSGRQPASSPPPSGRSSGTTRRTRRCCSRARCEKRGQTPFFRGAS